MLRNKSQYAQVLSYRHPVVLSLVTGLYLPQLNSNNSEQKVEEHRYKHDVPDCFHGYKNALYYML